MEHDQYYYKRSGQIPAFGDWDHANDLPITQYFESARQAGLLRFSSSSGESDPYNFNRLAGGGTNNNNDLYAVDFKKHSCTLDPPNKKVRVGEKRGAHVKEQRKQGKVCDVSEPASKGSKQLQNDVVRSRLPVRPHKPVDEDLYKIPPELLRSSKRKKMPGLFSCLVPACAT